MQSVWCLINFEDVEHLDQVILKSAEHQVPIKEVNGGRFCRVNCGASAECVLQDGFTVQETRHAWFRKPCSGGRCNDESGRF